MNYHHKLDDNNYKYTKVLKKVIRYIKGEFQDINKKVKIMEVCGTHTRVIIKSGIRNLLPDNISLISGPGCPICVTSQGYIDTAVKLAEREDIILTTFADLIRVPSQETSLYQTKVSGSDVRVVGSPLKAVEIARENPQSEIVFLAIGFETTAPLIALSIRKADRLKLDNFSILLSLKTMPEVIKKLVRAQEITIDGFICPGHVSAITGWKNFNFIAERYNLPAVIAGFERTDIVLGMVRILEMINNNFSKVENLYGRVVKRQGNIKAKALIDEIFETSDNNWRGLGKIKNSGLRLKDEFRRFKAEDKFKINLIRKRQDSTCSCGDILKGKETPFDCILFAVSCTPTDPHGPCMVSEEGTCNIYYEYKRKTCIEN